MSEHQLTETDLSLSNTFKSSISKLLKVENETILMELKQKYNNIPKQAIINWCIGIWKDISLLAQISLNLCDSIPNTSEWIDDVELII